MLHQHMGSGDEKDSCALTLTFSFSFLYSCPCLDPVFPKCPQAVACLRNIRCQSTTDTQMGLFVPNTWKILSGSNSSTDPAFPCHYGVFKGCFTLSCQFLSAISKLHLEMTSNSWIDMMCSLETCLGLPPQMCCAASVPQHRMAWGRSTQPKAPGSHLGVLVLEPSPFGLQSTWWICEPRREANLHEPESHTPLKARPRISITWPTPSGILAQVNPQVYVLKFNLSLQHQGDVRHWTLPDLVGLSTSPCWGCSSNVPTDPFGASLWKHHS